MKPEIKQFKTPEFAAEALAKEFAAIAEEYSAKKKTVNIALSGGETPKMLFKLLASQYKRRINWSGIHFYWADERCVPPVNEECNYWVAKELLFSKIQMHASCIHRIKGERDPELEAIRYEQEVRKTVRGFNNLPQFDLILLGLGPDGHTASIFPDDIGLFKAEILYSVTDKPDSKQKRITMTGPVINNAERVFYLVTGEEKSEIMKTVLNGTKAEDKKKIPASKVNPLTGKLVLFADDAALSKIEAE